MVARQRTVRWRRRVAGAVVAAGIVVGVAAPGAPAAAVPGGASTGTATFIHPLARVIFNLCVFVPWCDPPGPPQ